MKARITYRIMRRGREHPSSFGSFEWLKDRDKVVGNGGVPSIGWKVTLEGSTYIVDDIEMDAISGEVIVFLKPKGPGDYSLSPGNFSR